MTIEGSRATCPNDDRSNAMITRQPTGPVGFPLVGHVFQFKRDPLKLLNEVRTHGDIVRLRFGPKVAFVVNHPDLIEDVLVTHHRLMVKTSGRKFTRLSRFLSRGDLVDRVVHFPADADDVFWRRERPTLQSVFANSQISRYAHVMIEIIHDLIADWQTGQVRDLYREMRLLTFRIVAKTLFGSDDRDAEPKRLAAFDVIMSAIATRIANPFGLPVIVPTPSNRRLVGAVQEAATILDALAQRQVRATGTGDLVDVMLEGNRLHDDMWRYNVISILIAGYETSAVALTWIWYLLSRHPEVAGRLQSEIDRVVGGRVVGEADVRALVYTEAVVQEALRLYPPIWLTARESTEDLQLGSFHVPAGSILMISPWVTHRDSRFYDDPDGFHPERWLSPEASQPPKYAFFPFSGGPRHCIGQRFARTEIMLAVATIASLFTLSPPSQREVVPKPWIALRPDGAVPMIVTRREK